MERTAMPPRKQAAAEVAGGDKKLTSDRLVVTDIPVLNGTYLITADDESVDRNDVWFVPQGVQAIESGEIKAIDQDLRLSEALIAIGRLVAKDLKDMPTEPTTVDEDTKPKPEPAKATARRAPAKKAPAVNKAAAKARAPRKPSAPPVATKTATRRSTARRTTVQASPAAKRAVARKPVPQHGGGVRRRTSTK